MDSVKLWTGGSFTIVVRSNQDRLTVPRGVLERIPYFRVALRTNTFVEAQESIFKLTDYDIQAVADAFQYACSNYVEPIASKIKNSGDNQTKQREIVRRYTNAYILTDKWDMENWSNEILDAFITYHRSEPPNPSIIALLRESPLEGSLLHSFIMDSCAYHLLHKSYKPSKMHNESGNFINRV